MTQVLDCLIIGASAAGLATAACLKHSGQTFEMLEASDVVGQSWRHHYDRLHLHTPKSLSSLPGLAMPLATTGDDEWCARNVVIATGANSQPIRPTWPGLDSFRGQVMHSSEYRNGIPWKGQPVLVVGFGNSAYEQAIDLVEGGSQAHLAVRSPVNVIPRDIFGVVPVLQLGIVMQHLPPAVADALAWPMIRATIGDIRQVGLRKLPYGPNTQIARDRHIPLLDIGTMEHIRAGRIRVHPDIQRFTPDGVVFTDGETLAVEAVVLATGYRPALDDFLVQWREVRDEQGIPFRSGGPTALPGLYFCGQFVSPAGMLRQIRIEAGRVASHLARA